MFPYTCFTTLIAPVGICLRAWIILIYTRRCKWQLDSGWSVVWIWCLVEHVITSILFCRQHVNLDTKLYEVTGLKNLSPQIIRIYLNHQAPAFILVKKKKWFLETAFKGWMILPAVNCMNNCRILYKEWVEKRVIDSLVSDRFSEARWEGSCSCQSRLLSTQRHMLPQYLGFLNESPRAIKCLFFKTDGNTVLGKSEDFNTFQVLKIFVIDYRGSSKGRGTLLEWNNWGP